MLRLLLICCAGLLVEAALAQEVSPESVRDNVLRNRQLLGQVSYSRSRQFVVHGSPRTGWLPQLGNPPGVDLVRLERAILAVSAERVKDALLRQFVLKDDWRCPIHLELHPAQSLDETIDLNSVWTGQTWVYHVRLPDAVRRERVAEALVGALLREIANRNSTGAAADVPAWLTEGLTRKLLLTSPNPADLILDPPNKTIRGVSLREVSWSAAREDPLKGAHERMRQQAPLTWEELSWPHEDQFAGAAAESFRNSSQLLVEELLRLEDGPACLLKFLNGLSSHLNWQISFLDAFQKHFPTQRDLEKWWALRVVDFTGRDLSLTWPPDVSWLKLDEIVRSQVQVRSSANELPLRTQVSLQTILTDWDFAQQEKVLRDKLQQLMMLRSHVSQDQVRLVDDYRQVLADYLGWREKSGFAHSVQGKATPAMQPILRDTLRDLEALDRRRMALFQALQVTNSPSPEVTKAPVSR